MQLTRWQIIRSKAFMLVVGIQRHMTLGARVMLIDEDRVYLIRHTYMPGWFLPGGGVETNENAESSAVREVLEESGYRLTARPKLFGFYHNVTPFTRRDHVALYVSRDFERAFDFKANREIAEFGWFAIDNLPAGIDEGTVRRVAEVFHGIEPSAEWEEPVPRPA